MLLTQQNPLHKDVKYFTVNHESTYREIDLKAHCMQQKCPESDWDHKSPFQFNRQHL